jgi:hypothetical protein
MTRFWGNHGGTRQVSGSKKVRPAPAAERLASMETELARRIRAYGKDHPLVERQRQAIARERRP